MGIFFFVFLTILYLKTTLTLFLFKDGILQPHNIKEFSILCPICKEKM